MLRAQINKADQANVESLIDYLIPESIRIHYTTEKKSGSKPCLAKSKFEELMIQIFSELLGADFDAEAIWNEKLRNYYLSYYRDSVNYRET